MTFRPHQGCANPPMPNGPLVIINSEQNLSKKRKPQMERFGMNKLTKRLTDRLPILIGAVLLITLLAGYGVQHWRVSQATFHQKADLAKLRNSFGKLPLGFEPNVGQTDGQVKFLAHGDRYKVFLTGDQAVLQLKTGPVVSVKFAEKNTAKAEGIERQAAITNYYIGHRSKWLEKVPNYGAVRYAGVYPGVDAVFRGNERQLRYDFVVKAGADPKAIRMEFGGIKSMKVNEGGELVLNTGAADLIQQRPYISQEVHGKRQQVEGGYVLTADNKVGFRLGTYDRNRELIIDPTFQFGVYVAGTGTDEVLGMMQDAAGVYLVGDTTSTVFPAQANVGLPGTKPGASTVDAFVVSMNRAGTVLNYRTFWGGDGVDKFRGVTSNFTEPSVLYVVGDTTSTVGSDAQTVTTGPGVVSNNDTLLAATDLNPTGQQAVVMTLDRTTGVLTAGGKALGSAAGTTYGYTIVSNGTTGVWVGGKTTGLDVTNDKIVAGSQQTYQGGASDGYISALTVAAGTATLVQSTYVGGAGDDSVNSLILAGGGIVGVGTTTSYATAGFPSTPNAYQKEHNPVAGNDAFIVSLPLTLTGAFKYCSFFGGSADDQANGVAQDNDGNLYFTGQTSSTDFGTNLLNAPAGLADAYVVKFLTAAGNTGLSYTYAWTRYIGGPGNDIGNAIAVDNLDTVNKQYQAYVVGQTFSQSGFPIVDSVPEETNPLQTAFVAPSAAFLTRLNFAGTAVNYSGLDGTIGNSSANAIALDTTGGTAPTTAFFAGSTNGGIVVGGGEFQTIAVADLDGFVSAVRFNDLKFGTNPLATTVTNGVPVALPATTLVFTYGAGVTPTFSANICPAQALNAVLIGTQSLACTGDTPTWFNLPGAGGATYVAGNPGTLTLTLTAAANTLPAGNYTATVTATGAFDNNPQVLTVTLKVFNALNSTPGLYVRTFQKDSPTQNTSATLNQDSFAINMSTAPSLSYTATLVDMGGTTGANSCNTQGSWLTISSAVPAPTGIVEVSAGTPLVVTYNPAVLQSMDLRNVESPTTTPRCTAHILVTTPANTNLTTNNVPSLNLTVQMDFSSGVVPSLSIVTHPTYGLAGGGHTVTSPLVFNFNSPNSASQAQIVSFQGDSLPLSFTSGITNATFGGPCTVGVTVSPLVPGAPPFIAPDTNGTGLIGGGNTASTLVSFSVTVNPLSCTNNHQFTGASVNFTPSGPAAGASVGFTPLDIPIIANVGSVLVTTPGTPGNFQFTGPNTGGNVLDTPTGYHQTGVSVASDLTAPTTAATVTVSGTNQGPPIPTFPFNLTVSTSAATGTSCVRAGQTGVATAATAGGTVTTDWLQVTSSSATAGYTPNSATLSFAVNPAVWGAMQSTANGCLYSGTVTVSSAVGGSPQTYSLSFTKINQPVQPSTAGPLTFVGTVGQGLLPVQPFTVTTPAIAPLFSVDVRTDPAASYPGFNYPNRLNLAATTDTDTGVTGFINGANLQSWLRLTPAPAIPAANLGFTNASVTPATVTVFADTANLSASPTVAVPNGDPTQCPVGTIFVGAPTYPSVIPSVCATPYTGVIRLRSGDRASVSDSGQNVVEIPVNFVLSPQLNSLYLGTLGTASIVQSAIFTIGNNASTPICGPFNDVLGTVNGLVITPVVTTDNGGPSWITTHQLGGTTPSQIQACVTPALLTSLTAGTFTGKVTLTSPNTQSAVINISLQVNAQPVIVAPGTASYAYVWNGAAPASQALNVTSIPDTPGATSLVLTTSGDCSWLNSALAATTAPTTINTSLVTPLTKAPGSYGPCTLTVNGTGGTQSAPAIPSNTVVSLSVAATPFFASAVNIGNGVYTMSFPGANLFGTFAYLASNQIIFHFDLGYEGIVVAHDASNGVYMYDMSSGHWWYTNPSTFPYIYDFTLNTWIYYFPNQNVAGHYTTNPRYFANMTTSQIFTM